MNVNKMMEQIKNHPDYDKVGMILTHNGVVRGTSRDGRKVSGLSIDVDREKLEKIVAEKKKYPGILEILVEITEEKNLKVGDDVMYIVVAGDIRENVLSALSDTLNEIKSTVTSKTEFFIG